MHLTQTISVVSQINSLNEDQGKILSRWIKNQPLYQEQANPRNAGLSEEQVETIIRIRKQISAQTNH